MESPELEPMASNSSTTSDDIPSSPVVKGKRTKRQRATVATATSSTSSADLSETTEEEEDMAHCLILLAHGRSLNSPPPAEKFNSRRFTEAATTAGGKAGFYVYECKTCSKRFPSFQALGGHRASHKKPKFAIPPPPPAPPQALEDKKPIIGEAASGNCKSRVHECSICGSEFSSGQALGGHMRRHRPSEVKKERNVLSLDLNLPAPSEDQDRSDLVDFPFAIKRPMVFSSAAAAPPQLIDCHY